MTDEQGRRTMDKNNFSEIYKKYEDKDSRIKVIKKRNIGTEWTEGHSFSSRL